MSLCCFGGIRSIAAIMSFRRDSIADADSQSSVVAPTTGVRPESVEPIASAESSVSLILPGISRHPSALRPHLRMGKRRTTDRAALRFSAQRQKLNPSSLGGDRAPLPKRTRSPVGRLDWRTLYGCLGGRSATSSLPIGPGLVSGADFRSALPRVRSPPGPSSALQPHR